MNRNYLVVIFVILAILSYLYFSKKIPLESDNAEVVELDPSMSHEELVNFSQIESPEEQSYAYESGAIRGSMPDNFADSSNLRTYFLDNNNNGLPDEEFQIHRTSGGSGPNFGTGGGISGGGSGGISGGGSGGMGRGGSRGYSGHWRRNRRPYRNLYPYRNFYPYSYGYYPYDYNYSFPYSTQQFTVRITDKQSTHPYYNQGYPLGYSIIGSEGSTCGISGGKIVLRRGLTYQFNISTGRACDTGKLVNEPFFFSSSSSGGSTNGNIFGVRPVVNGVLTITVDNSIPNLFYYQSSNHKYVGGIIEVI